MARNLVGHAEHRLPDLLGQSGVEKTLQHRERRGRGLLGRLQDHRATRRNRRAELAAGIADREIPRRKRRHRPDRLVDHRRAHAGRTHQLPSVDPVAFAGIELEQADVHQHFEARLGERLALLERRDARDLLLTLEQQARGTRQHGSALLRGGLAPQTEAALRGRERPVEIRRIRQRQLAERRPGRRIHHRVRATMADGDPLPVDDHVQLGIVTCSARLELLEPRAARPRGHRA